MNSLNNRSNFIVVVLIIACVLSTCKLNILQSEAPESGPASEAAIGHNKISKAEVKDGWVLLFDGKSTDGWRGVHRKSFPESGWNIEAGALHCIGSGKGEAGGRGGDIIYDREFSNFHIKIDWKIEEGGNSGIFYLGKEVEGKKIWMTCPEMQVLDNERHPDAFLGKDGNRQAGSLYDIIPAKPQNANPAGQWNSSEIIVFNGTVVHKQNGEVVLEYHLWTDEWNEMVSRSKFPKINHDWANISGKGYFGLQDHGDHVWFRNIKIKEL